METEKNFIFYLTGLIEGDGSFIVPNTTRDTKGKLKYAKVKIAFHINDKPLFDILKKNLGGVFELYKNYGVLIINKNEELISICNLINGYFRTPKINDFHRMIDYLNVKNNISIPKLGLDSRPIDTNAWLSGFSDADANFNLLITNRKNSKKRVQIQYRVEIKRFYSKKINRVLPLNYYDYYYIVEEIAQFLGVGIYIRSRPERFYGLIVSSYSKHSNEKVIEYFEKFPLFSSKRLNYNDWKIIYRLQSEKLHLTPEGLKTCENTKKTFNKNRKVFCWNHLKEFYIKN
jgi:hypothetical protein